MQIAFHTQVETSLSISMNFDTVHRYSIYDLNKLGPSQVNMYTQVHCMARKVDDDVQMSFLLLSP